jgi:hypothetical protein
MPRNDLHGFESFHRFGCRKTWFLHGYEKRQHSRQPVETKRLLAGGSIDDEEAGMV